MPSSDSADPAVYQRGDALDEVLPPELTGRGPSAARSTEEWAADAGIYDLSEQEYWNWLATLIQEGSELDEHLDDILEDVYDLEPAFYSRNGRRALQERLRQLHEVRTSVRAFEQDVEQLSFVFARADTVETGGADNAELVLSSIKRTYDRAYDLCLYKLDRISDGWVTATNLLISLTILVVTILFWLEFR
ncbi:hypothetical protein GGP91_000301 [Salinibacter ruber]|jgi:hypothetical protein|uniref:Uncharacterized protein n=2 Tax=Salinibacter ruber TaxID=146919 RepID=Q2S4E0_SALRD|nr:hypothetical protein [Salinibacter ruber]ABC43629.1 hypothetical protein SRU_0805 [Salinibacter ruber DSM 13855]MBB4061929.1 hypothetical protein [Salinibacter ruber]MBB4067648.1 hypothetical protein [Salinibacter ruber]MBB4091196.1 hypothetical protein [Salinibacter ruber]MCS3611453.1 hypothetical protein [Salinibacter ruber]